MFRLIIAASLFLCLLGAVCSADEPVEISRIRVENSANGRVQVSLDYGKTFTTVGRVRRPATAAILGFAAATYMPDSTVAATAVHGLRIKTSTRQSEKTVEPLTVSIVPDEFAETPRGYGGHIPYESGIYTDIPAGTSIFRSLAPFAGNPVKLERNGSLVDIPSGWQPKSGDVIEIIAQLPQPYLRKLEFQNHKDGDVTAEYTDGTVKRVATVLQPVKGTGRFDGTSYTGVGLINTNHGGVVTISTAPISTSKLFEGQGPEKRGGFEIQPSEHAKTQPPMPQAMVVGPVDGKPIEGQPPIFRGFIGLAYDPKNPEESVRVEMSRDGKTWQPLLKSLDKVDDKIASHGITNLRILFPPYDGKFLTRSLVTAKNEFEKRKKIEKPVVTNVKVKPENVFRGTMILRPSKTANVGLVVTYNLDGELLCVTSQPPYEYIWDTTAVSNGIHKLQIQVNDSDDREISVQERVILVDNR